MSEPHEFRDRFGPAFEASDTVVGLGLPIKHGSCKCGNIVCAYADPATGLAFSGFVAAFYYLLEKGVAVEGLTIRTKVKS